MSKYNFHSLDTLDAKPVKPPSKGIPKIESRRKKGKEPVQRKSQKLSTPSTSKNGEDANQAELELMVPVKKQVYSRDNFLNKKPKFKTIIEKPPVFLNGERDSKQKLNYNESTDEDEIQTKKKHKKSPKKLPKKSNSEIDALLAESNFVIPEKRSAFTSSTEIQFDFLSDPTLFEQAPKSKCPIDHTCKYGIKFPFSKVLQGYYTKYLAVSEDYKKKLIGIEAVDNAKHRFCNYHHAEVDIIPLGLKKGT